MQHAWKHVERPGGSHTALDGKKLVLHVFLIVTQWMPLRPTADRFGGCFCLGSGPVFGLFWCCFAFCLVSAGETQVWLGDLRVVAFCVVVVFVVLF